MLFCRRYGTTLLNSVMTETKNVLKQLGIYDYCQISDYNKRYILPNGTEIIFMGLDDEQKLLSISDIATIFVEEVYEVEASIMDQLDLRLRANGVPLEIYACFNPISKNSYLYERLIEEREKYFPEDTLFLLKTTFEDNKFVSEEYKDSIRKLEKSNYKKWVVYGLGEFGSNQEALVYKNVTVKKFKIDKILALANNKGVEIRIGIDFGVVDPIALTVSVFDHNNKRIYIVDEHYEVGMTLEAIYQMLVKKGLHKTRCKFYGDSADARCMQFLKSKGIRIEGVKKVKIGEGISFLQDYHIYVNQECTNTQAEFENYCYYLNKKTNKFEEDKYVGPDHLMDALRYSASDLYTTNSLKLTDKSIYSI